MPYVFSSHALQEMGRRNIPREFVEAVLDNPEQVVLGKDDCRIYQSRLDFGEGNCRSCCRAAFGDYGLSHGQN